MRFLMNLALTLKWKQGEYMGLRSINLTNTGIHYQFVYTERYSWFSRELRIPLNTTMSTISVPKSTYTSTRNELGEAFNFADSFGGQKLDGFSFVKMNRTSASNEFPLLVGHFWALLSRFAWFFAWKSSSLFFWKRPCPRLKSRIFNLKMLWLEV